METESRSDYTLADVVRIISRRILLFLLLFFSVVGAAVIVSLLLPATFKAGAKLIVDNEPSPAGTAVFSAADDAYLNTQKEIITSPSLVKAALVAVQEKGYLKDADYESMRRRVKAGYRETSHVLEVAVYHRDAQAAAELANAVVNSFFDYHRKSRVAVVAGSLAAVSKAQDAVKAQLDAVEDKLKSFGNKQDAAYYQSQVPQYVNTLIELEQKNLKSQEDVKRLRDELVKTKAILKSGDSSSFYPLLPQVSASSTAQENPTASLAGIPWIQDVKSKLATAESELAALTAEYTDNNPEVEKLRSKLEGIRLNLAAELNRIMMTYADYYRGYIVYLESQSDAQDAQQARYREELNNIAAKIRQAAESEIKYAVLQKQYEMLSEVYGAYARRQGELTLMKEQAELEAFPNLRSFELAQVPRLPFSPNLPLNAAVGVVLGFLTGLVGCLAEERKSRTRNVPLMDKAAAPAAAPARFDRRGMKRVEKDLTVVYTVAGVPVKKYARTVNVSGTGICLELKDIVKHKAGVSFDIQLAHDDYVHPSGKVVWVRPDKQRRVFQTGVNFEEMAGSDREKLLKYLYGESGLTG